VLNLFLIFFGKVISKIFKISNLGNGSTWPGHIALNLNKNFIKQILKKSNTKIIVVAGTNGKTTTSSLISTTLNDNGREVIQNLSGANLLNGIASTLISNSDFKGKLNADFAIFEIDENTLPLIIKEYPPDFIIILNLFRDQLDRYGEVNIIASNWKKAFNQLSDKTTLILNADDPQVAYFSNDIKAKTLFFGLNEVNENENVKIQASDSDYCPKCGKKLNYANRVFSHLGDWDCQNCGLKRPNLNISKFSSYPLPGTYNKYNSLASILLLRQIGISDKAIESAFAKFTPVFGRQEIIDYKDKKIQIFLSKNPTSFNQSFKTISELKAKSLLIILNDRVPDGHDISWIWDTELSNIDEFNNILLAGDRVYDMALRLKYELGISNFQSKVKTFEELSMAIDNGVRMVSEDETLFILPTYSAMLDVRKILTGKKIL
jgi:lipid II isoglutaminyl synthase (glutamine-hydrolysing)